MKARNNPFRVERQHALRYRFAEGDWPALLSRLKNSGYRGAVVGPHGAGKTTLLEELAARLRESGLAAPRLRLTDDDAPQAPHRVATWRASWPSDATRQIVLILDGAEQLSAAAWEQLLRSLPEDWGLVISTHEPGRLPTLWSCQTSPELLSDLVRELGGEEAHWPEGLKGLYARHQGNIRDCLRELYDRHA
jgi:hypothetical protein